MPPLLEHPLQHLLSRSEQNTPRWIIGMAGLPGAGKSTLAGRLADEVNACTAPNTLVALGMDGFHLSRAQLRQLPDPAEAFARRGAPWTFAPLYFLDRLRQLRAGAGNTAVSWPGFQHDVGDPVEEAFSVPPETRLILVEGLYLLHDDDGWERVRGFFDERWYLDTPLDVAMEWLSRRHQQAWGVSRAEAESRIAANDRLNAEIVRASAPRAEWRVVV